MTFNGTGSSEVGNVSLTGLGDSNATYANCLFDVPYGLPFGQTAVAGATATGLTCFVVPSDDLANLLLAVPDYGGSDETAVYFATH